VLPSPNVSTRAGQDQFLATGSRVQGVVASTRGRLLPGSLSFLQAQVLIGRGSLRVWSGPVEVSTPVGPALVWGENLGLSEGNGLTNEEEKSQRGPLPEVSAAYGRMVE
jgi:hypothetical protein